jgi:hypothetical protein
MPIGYNVLWRGSSKGSKLLNGAYKKTVRKDRKPLDMNSDASELFDKKFMEKFGIKPRSSGVFSTTDWNIASVYPRGRNTGIFLFFPIGEYKYLWSPDIKDLYNKISYDNWYRFLKRKESGIRSYKNNHFDYDETGKLVGDLSDEQIAEILKLEAKETIEKMVESYQTHGLKEAMEKKHEITFICDEYYLIDFDERIIKEFYDN